MKNFMKITLIAALVILTGCATIIAGKSQSVTLNSTPAGAEVSITDERGTVVFQGVTPATVSLEKHAGYFKGKRYTMVLQKPGYEAVQIPVTPHVNGWYIGGNILFGGLIGWLIVDPLTGAMYTLSPDQVDANLRANSLSFNTKSGNLSVVMLEDVPASLRDQLVVVK